MSIFYHNNKEWFLSSVLIIVTSLLFIVHQSNQDYSQSSTLSDDNIKVMTPDWGIGATLTELGLPPFAMSAKKSYKTWVVTPPLPQSVIDVGLRGAPNPELISSLHPDLIVDNFFYEDNRTIYNPTTPVESITFGFDFENMDTTKPPEWSKMVDSTLKLGRLIERPKRTELYIKNSRQQIEAAGTVVRQHMGDKRKIVVANFYSVQEINFFDINSPMQLATDIMGLDLVSLGTPNDYGFASVPLHQIYEIPDDACLIIMEPISPFIKYQLKNSLIWQNSRFSQPDACLYVIKPVWYYGGINVLVQFAENFAEEVANPRDHNLMLDPASEMKAIKTQPVDTQFDESKVVHYD